MKALTRSGIELGWIDELHQFGYVDSAVDALRKSTIMEILTFQNHQKIHASKWYRWAVMNLMNEWLSIDNWSFCQIYCQHLKLEWVETNNQLGNFCWDFLKYTVLE